MATKTVTDQSFASDVLGSDSPVLVDFWAEWCGPCRMIAPALEEIAGELGDKVTIAKLNIDENPDTPSRYGVRGIPTMLLFKGGQPVAQKVGAAPRSQIQQWLEGQPRRHSQSNAAATHGRLGSFEAPGVRPELVVPRQVVLGSNQPTLLPQKMWKPGAIASGSSSVATLKSTVSGWWSTFIRKGVPHSPQKARWPKLDEGTDFTLSRALGPDEVAVGHAREHHRRRAADQLAGAAMAPAAIERLALEARNAPRRTCTRRSVP